MIEVVIDTSIYRSDPNRKKAAFRVLTRLAESGFVRIHIPHVVEKEFTSQQLSLIDDSFGHAAKFLSELKKRIPASTKENLDRLEEGVDRLKCILEADSARSMRRWAGAVNAEFHDPLPHHGKLVLDAYFSGGQPFSQPKERKGFPDAFVYQAVKDLSEDRPLINFVSSDNRLREGCSTLDSVAVFASLEEFLKARPCQEAARNLQHLDKVKYFRQHIFKYQDLIQRHINDLLLNYLPYHSFVDPHFKSDDNTGVIEMVGEADRVEISEDGIETLGLDTIVVPFSCRTDAVVYYSLFAADYLAMKENEADLITISHDENSSDHYLEASEEVTLQMEGAFSISFSFESDQHSDESESDFRDYLEGADVSLEQLFSLQIVA